MANLRQDKKEVLFLAGALMEHFLEGVAPLRHWYNGTLTQIRTVINTDILF